MPINMGIGNLGFRNTIFKTKFRFTFEVVNICNNPSRRIPEHHVKTVDRPKLSIEETEINHLNGKTWIPGKASWETISVTYIDAVNPDNVSTTKALFDWLSTIYHFNDPTRLRMASIKNDYAATGILKMWDGCGNALETWTLYDLWPTNVDFGNVDYSSSEEATIDLTLRYSNVIYTPDCPLFSIDPCCTPCGF